MGSQSGLGYTFLIFCLVSISANLATGNYMTLFLPVTTIGSWILTERYCQIGVDDRLFWPYFIVSQIALFMYIGMSFSAIGQFLDSLNLPKSASANFEIHLE